MADEQYIVDFVSRVGSYEQGVEALVKAHARLTSQFDRTSKAGDRVEKQLLGLSGAMDKSSKGITTMSGATYANDKALQTASKQTALYNQYLFDQDKALNRSTQGLITQRYALYDVATTYGAIGAALLGASAYAIKVGADFERSFTNVQRTLDLTGESATLALGQIRAELVDLSTQIPLTFTELTEIATLGNQLGIASEDLIEFTRTVAQFSAVTGVTISETAQAFGSLGNIMGLTSDQFDNLGSAIALAGRRGVTTEAQILSLTREVAQQATDAGFAADQVVGLAAALGNLRLPPERSRGALTTYFQTLNAAVAEGGTKLQDFATIVGVTSSQLEEMVRSGQGAEVFRRFIQSLESLDNVDTTAALDRLGLAQLRVSDVFQRLSGDISKYDKALSDANEGFVEQAELAAQYALIADDLTSRFQELVNAVNALIDAATGGQVSGLAGLVQTLIDLTNAARDFISTDVGQVFTRLALGAALFVGALFAVRAAQALATASTYALITAQTSLAASSGLSGIKGLVSTLLGYTTVVNGATVSTLTLTGAVKALAKATLVLAAIDFVFRLITDFEGLSAEVDNVTGGVFGLQDALDGMGDVMGEIGGLAYGVEDGMLRIGDAALSASDALLAATGPLGALIALWQAFNRESGGQGGGRRRTDGERVSRVGSFGSNASDTAAAAAATDDYASSLNRVGGAAGGAAKQVRTLLDYASDLGQVIDRAFDIRFGSQAALDQVTTSWIDLNEEIAEYQRKVAELTADRAIKSYFLSVAEAYGDALRAGVLRSEIADIDAELADATANASTELTGNSKAATINRKRINDLLKSYGDYVEALAAGGADQATLNAAVQQSRTDFLAQAQALGYSSAQLVPYVAHFNDMAIAVARVPRNVTVNFDPNPALQALNELEARVRAVKGGAGGGWSVPAPSLPDLYSAGVNLGNKFKTGFRTGANGALLYYDGTGAFRGSAGSVRFVRDGGYISGPGGPRSDKIPAMLSDGEFVMTAKATRNAGAGNLYGMMRAFESGRGYAMGGHVSPVPVAAGGGGMMGLSPQDRAILRGILDAVKQVQPGYLPDEVISRASQRGDKVRQSRGEI